MILPASPPPMEWLSAAPRVQPTKLRAAAPAPAPERGESFEQVLSRQDKPRKSVEPAASEARDPNTKKAEKPAESAEAGKAAEPAKTQAEQDAPADETVDVEVANAQALLALALPVAVEEQPAATAVTETPAPAQEPAAPLAPTVKVEGAPRPVAQQVMVEQATAGPVATLAATGQGAAQPQQQGEGSQQQSQPQAASAPQIAPAAEALATTDKPSVPAAPQAPTPPLMVASLTASPGAPAQPVSAEPVAAPAPLQATGEAAPRSEPDALNAARLARGLQNAVNQRGGAVTLRLTPPEMGTVRVEMQITASRVSVQFHAETTRGQALLAQHLGQLRTALEGQGLQVDRMGVQTMQPAQHAGVAHAASPSHDTSSSSQQQHQQDGRTDDGRSRGSFDRRGDPSRDDRQRGAEEEPASFSQFFEQGKER